MDDHQNSSWSGKDRGHLCNCIGCCKKCGSCRTNPNHTAEICELLQKQHRELEDAVAAQRSPLGGSQLPQDATVGETGTTGPTACLGTP